MENVESRVTHCRGWWSGRRRYGHRGFCDGLSSPGRDKCQKEPKTRWDFWRRSRSRSDGINIVAHVEAWDNRRPTLLACFCFSFSKIFCDWVLVASDMLTRKFLDNQTRGCVVRGRVLKTALRLEYWAPARKGPTSPTSPALASSPTLHVCFYLSVNS